MLYRGNHTSRRAFIGTSKIYSHQQRRHFGNAKITSVKLESRGTLEGESCDCRSVSGRVVRGLAWFVVGVAFGRSGGVGSLEVAFSRLQLFVSMGSDESVCVAQSTRGWLVRDSVAVQRSQESRGWHD
jgi:hypothetical protein